MSTSIATHAQPCLRHPASFRTGTGLTRAAGRLQHGTSPWSCARQSAGLPMDLRTKCPIECPLARNLSPCTPMTRASHKSSPAFASCRLTGAGMDLPGVAHPAASKGQTSTDRKPSQQCEILSGPVRGNHECISAMDLDTGLLNQEIQKADRRYFEVLTTPERKDTWAPGLLGVNLDCPPRKSARGCTPRSVERIASRWPFVLLRFETQRGIQC